MASTIVQHGKASVSGREFAFVLKRMPGRRHVHLYVSDDGELEVRAPWRFSTRRAEAVIVEHGSWVLDFVDRARDRIAARPRLGDGATIRLLDEELRLRVECRGQLDFFEADRGSAGRTGAGAVRREGASLRVIVPRPGAGALRETLEPWYREQARRWCAARVDRYAPILAVRPRRISIRGQRTRWGSCSDRGTVSLNWRLMQVPAALADYIVVHELCHLRHMDHSRQFWSLVESVIPDYRLRKRQLDELQDQLPV